jgi:hypothetical protein
MVMWSGTKDGHSYRVEADQIEVTSPYPAVDPQWVGRCPNNHITSTEAAKSRQVFVERCDGSCGVNESHDVTVTEWFCRCGAPVSPGVTPPFMRQYIPGYTTYFVDDEQVSETEFLRRVNA